MRSCWIETWEATAERLLREHAEAAGLDPFFGVVGRAERLAMLLDRFDELPMRKAGEIRGNPAGLLARLLERIDALKAGSDPAEPELARLCAAHDKILADAGAIDRGDLFLILNRLLDVRPDVREAIAARFPQRDGRRARGDERRPARGARRARGGGELRSSTSTRSRRRRQPPGSTRSIAAAT